MDNQVEVLDVALIHEQVRDFISVNFLFDGDARQIDDEVSLIEQGIVDSTGVLELVLFVEETYGLSVDHADLVPENFDSVNALVGYVERRLA
jgi:acyl carrier protein